MSDVSHHETTGSHSREIRAGFIAVFAGISAVGLGVMLVVLQSLYLQVSEQEIHRKVLSRPSAELADLRAAEQASLAGYKALDKAKGVYQLPIDRAMELVVREYAGRKAAGGGSPTGGASESGALPLEGTAAPAVAPGGETAPAPQAAPASSPEAAPGGPTHP